MIESLVKFLGHENASQITRVDIIRWKDQLLQTLSPKTVRDSYLATARAAFGWAVDNLQTSENPFKEIKVRLSKKNRNREKGFLDHEAVALLRASRNYAGSEREQETMTRAKQWTPMLAAYTGARIGELTQLRAEDVKVSGVIHFIRIAPDAGTVKSGEYRDVPLHSHIIEAGFLEYVAAKVHGPLFYNATPRRGKGMPSAFVASRLAKWIRSLDLVSNAVQPNHGWRHRMTTVGQVLKWNARVLDAIQGHAGRTAGENYGDVTLKTKQEAIASLPRYCWT